VRPQGAVNFLGMAPTRILPSLPSHAPLPVQGLGRGEWSGQPWGASSTSRVRYVPKWRWGALVSWSKPRPCLLAQFTFYAQYHNNFINQVIHIVCVWPILWTALVLLSLTPAVVPTPAFLPPSVIINGAFIGAAIYTLFYLGMEVANVRSLAGAGALAVRRHAS
jgi:hypothetical protein